MEKENLHESFEIDYPYSFAPPLFYSPMGMVTGLPPPETQVSIPAAQPTTAISKHSGASATGKSKSGLSQSHLKFGWAAAIALASLFSIRVLNGMQASRCPNYQIGRSKKGKNG